MEVIIQRKWNLKKLSVGQLTTLRWKTLGSHFGSELADFPDFRAFAQFDFMIRISCRLIMAESIFFNKCKYFSK
jgi:hypothetical protein